MSLWDNVKKFAQPYADDDYDDYGEDDDYLDDYEEPEKPAPARRKPRRAPAPAPAPEEEEEEEEEEDVNLVIQESTPKTVRAMQLSTAPLTGWDGAVLTGGTYTDQNCDAVAVTMKDSAGHIYFDAAGAVSGAVRTEAGTAAALEALNAGEAALYRVNTALGSKAGKALDRETRTKIKEAERTLERVLKHKKVDKLTPVDVNAINTAREALSAVAAPLVARWESEKG